MNPLKIEDNIDKVTEDRLLLAWSLIIDQFFQKSKEVSSEEGPGISIFKFLRCQKESGHNCKYAFSSIDSSIAKYILENCKFQREIKEIYDYTKHIIICIQVPVGFYGDETIGNLKIFEIDTRKEIDLTVKNEEPKISNVSELRQRKKTSED